MKLSLDTLKVLSENGCEKASDAVNEWNTLSLMVADAATVVCKYDAMFDQFEVDVAWIHQPYYKRTLMGMPAVKV